MATRLMRFNPISHLKMILNVSQISCEVDTVKKGLVLGVYVESNGDLILTPTAQTFDDQLGGKLKTLIQKYGPGLKQGNVRVFHELCPAYGTVAVVGLGSQCLSYNEQEEVHDEREAVRTAAAAGCSSLQALENTDIWVEGLGCPESAAEGATLGLWQYQENKNVSKRKTTPHVHYFNTDGLDFWNVGMLKADSQNIARRLSDTPANLMTPTIFAKEAEDLLTQHGVGVKAHSAAWAEQMKMGSFLSVSRGSEEPPVFLEMVYQGGKPDDNPVVFVGKGVTFDSGGISIKPSKSMDEMRGDMGGAASVVASIHAAACMKLPINIVGLTPLCENMPSGRATKPGDVVTAMNGKTIKVDNTDAEGRLILADALCYAATFSPKFTLEIATLTGAMRVALGSAATGVFSNSTPLWQRLQKAGAVTGDRVWRFPLWDYYTKEITNGPSVDVINIGKGRGGGSCTAAAFLKEFAPPGEWMHLDIAGVSMPSDEMPYQKKGMTGRPTRTLIELLVQTAKLN